MLSVFLWKTIFRRERNMSQPMRKRQGAPKRRGLIRSLRHLPTMIRVFVRLAVAFTCGLLLAFLVTHVDMLPHPFAHFVNSALFVFIPFFPLSLGMFVPCTIQRRNKLLIPLSIGTGLCVIAGIYAYYLPLASQADAISKGLCGMPGAYCPGLFRVALINLFLCYGIVFVLVSASLTSFLLQRNRKKRGSPSSHEP
jgi:hypothetical protein